MSGSDEKKVFYHKAIPLYDIIQFKKFFVIFTADFNMALVDFNFDNNRMIELFHIKFGLNKVTNFQAGTYCLRQNMDLKQITSSLQTGIVEDPNQIKITYLEGKNIKWLAKEIARVTNNKEEDLFNILKDEEYINLLI